MTTVPPTAPSADRRPLRWGFAALALSVLALGVPATVAPRGFYEWFPFGRGWIGATGPYHGHLVADLGYAYLALGVVLVWAAVSPERQLARAAATGALVATAPHLVYHLATWSALPTADSVVENLLLGLSTVVGIWVLLASLRRD